MKNKKQVIFFGMIALLFLQIPALRADAETKVKREFQLTTYYPAPYGDYKEINTTGDTHLATSSGNVVIGTKDTNPKAKLEVNNTLLLTPVTGDAVAQTGGDEGAIRYSKDANGAGVGGLLYRNKSGWAPLAGGGGPVFITPQLLVSEGDPWNATTETTFDINLADYGVPEGARAVILEAEAAMNSPDGNPNEKTARIWVKISTATQKYLLLRGASASDHDRVAFGGQGTFPLDSTRKIKILIGPYSFNQGCEVRVVGYYM